MAILLAAVLLPDLDCFAATNDAPAITLLERFKTTDFSSFFGETNATFRKDNLGIFKKRTGYVTGGTLQTRYRGVGIAMYESHEAAMAAVEWRRKDVAEIITKGQKVRNGVSDWWFSESQALLSVVQGNMVFEVCVLDRRYSTVEDDLGAVATKFLRMIAEPDGGAKSRPADARASP